MYLDHDNIERSGGGVEYHPLLPFLPETARVLFLGSFPPPQKRWCMPFFYINNLYMLIISLINIFSWY